MTEDNAKKKLTLSGKSTLTLKLGATTKASNTDGKKMVQVEVRKKRVISQTTEPKTQKPQIDEETAVKLKLIAEAKELGLIIALTDHNTSFGLKEFMEAGRESKVI